MGVHLSLLGTIQYDRIILMPRKIRSPLHDVLTAAKQRCTNTKNPQYKNYGGRGIYVCDEWSTNSTLFIEWAVAAGYRSGLALDRRDNNGPYSPDNCRWVTQTENNRNSRQVRPVTAWDETKLIVDWLADSRCLVTGTTLRRRLNLGCTPEIAMTARTWSPYDPAKENFKCGHPRSEENTVSKRVSPKCRICHRNREAARRQAVRTYR